MGRGARFSLLFLVVLLVLAGGGAAYRFLSGPGLERWITRKAVRAVRERTGGLYRLDIGSIALDPFRGTASLRRVLLAPDEREVERRRARRALPPTLMSASFDSAGITGLHLFASWRARGLRADTLLIRSPLLRSRDVPPEAREARRREERQEASLRRARAGERHERPEASRGDEPPEETASSSLARMAASLPLLSLNRIVLDDGRLEAEGSARMIVRGVGARLDGVRIGGGRRDLSGRGVIFGDAFERTAAGGKGLLRSGPFRLSEPDSLLLVDSLSYRPAMSDPDFRARWPEEEYLYKAAVGRVAFRGLDAASLLRGAALSARATVIDGPVLEVGARLTGGPPDSGRRMMPNEAVRRIRRALRLQDVRIERGRIHYQEQRPGSRLGEITFGEISANVRNLTNDPALMTDATPAEVDAVTTVAGSGRMRVEIRIPLLSPSLRFVSRGRLISGMEAASLSPMFEGPAGVRIRSGKVDSLRFECRLESEGARGTMAAVYHDLKIEMVDPGTGKPDLKDRLRSLYVNTFVIRSDNAAAGGEPPRVGEIRWTHAPNETFFAYWWRALRSGIFSLVGMSPEAQVRR